jgi:hypothetical protein
VDCLDDLELHVRQSRQSAQGARQRWFHVLDLVSTSLRGMTRQSTRRHSRMDAQVTSAHDERGESLENAVQNYPAAMFAITAMDGGK